MDNFFFRQCMPYKVEIIENNLLIYNRDYKVVFNVINVDVKNALPILEKIACDRDDCLREHSCYLYDTATDPVNNENGFNKYLMEEYLKRLSIMFSEMAKIAG